MGPGKKVSVAVERVIKAYPPDRYRKLTLAYSEYTGDSVSGVVVTAVREFFDRMPLQEKDKILTLYGKAPKRDKNGY